MTTKYDFKKVHFTVPGDLFERMNENKLWKNLDEILIDFLDEYCEKLERGEV